MVWAASLVHPDVLEHARPGAEVIDSAQLPLEGVRPLYQRARDDGLVVARIHSGDPGAVGRGAGAAGPVRRARPAARDHPRGQRLRGGRRAGRPRTHRARGRPVGGADPARRRQDPDAARGGDPGTGPARHHHGGVPVRRPVQPAAGRAAGRRLPAGDAGDRGLPGDLAGRAPGGVHGRHAGRDGPGAQALEAHAVPGRARRWAPTAPGRGCITRATSTVSAGPTRTPAPRCARPAREWAGPGAEPAREPGGERPARESAAGPPTSRTGPEPQEPELREPDLPRTAKVRPRALRTGWTTGTCASAAAKAAATALRDQAPQHRVEIAPAQRPAGGLPGRVLRLLPPAGHGGRGQGRRRRPGRDPRRAPDRDRALAGGAGGGAGGRRRRRRGHQARAGHRGRRAGHHRDAPGHDHQRGGRGGRPGARGRW